MARLEIVERRHLREERPRRRVHGVAPARQRPARQCGGADQHLNFYLGRSPLDQGLPSAADWGFTRKSGTLPAVRITAIRAAGRPGKPVKLFYTVTFAAATVERVTVTRDGKAVWGAKGKAHAGSASAARYSFLWAAPKKPVGSYRFCVSGQPADGSLGWSKPSCAPIVVR